MSLELKQVAEQSLDLSTPTLREMVTRHAAVIDSRATLEDMPEALAFQIDMARALLREFAAIQQAEAQQPAPGVPDDVVRDAISTVREQYRGTDWGKAAECICDAIDAAMTAAQAQKGQP